MNNGEITGITHLYLCKAFDRVDHKRMLKYCPSTINWFESTLTNIKQAVIV